MAERDQKTIALVASRLLAAYMTAPSRRVVDEDRSTFGNGEADGAGHLFEYLAGFKLFDDSEHSADVEHLLFRFADLADRLIICCDPEAIDAWQKEPDPE